jgi:hypothetical protein
MSGDNRLLVGRYALQGPLGQGGMGVVWRATDLVLGRAVAIKQVRLLPEVPDQRRAGTQRRILREARAAARLNHPGAVTVHDVVQDGGEIFIVMELVEAPNLEQVVSQQGALGAERAARLGLEVLSALEVAHRAGIVHRDVKPSNILLPPDGGAKLSDFGIAQLQGDPQLTASGTVLGSPAYMAPEQASGEAGPAADLWSLGASLYFAVSGRPPFRGESVMATLAAVAQSEPEPPACDPRLGAVIMALLAKAPGSRPSGAGLRAQLERVTQPAQSRTVALRPATADRPAAEPATAAPEEIGGTAAGAEPAETDGTTASAVPARVEPASLPVPTGRAAGPSMAGSGRAPAETSPPARSARPRRTALAAAAAVVAVAVAVALIATQGRPSTGGQRAPSTTRAAAAGPTASIFGTTASTATTTSATATTSQRATATSAVAGGLPRTVQDGGLEFQVRSLSCGRRGSGALCVVALRVRNLEQAGRIYAASSQVLVDSAGGRHRHSFARAEEAGLPNADGSYLASGASADAGLAFELPDGRQAVRLELHGQPAGRGGTVLLR